MLRIVKKTVRPQASIPFFHELPIDADTKEWYIYYHHKFIKTGKQAASSKIISEDKLELLQESIWLSNDAFLELMCDAKFEKNQKVVNKYEQDNGIVSKLITIDKNYEYNP